MRERPRLVIAVCAVILCACGSSSAAARSSASPSAGASASASPSASPTAAGPCAAGLAAGSPRLMAVLERRASGGSQTDTRPFWHHDTVAIATLNGIGRAHASFQARSQPFVGNAATLMSPYEAYVVRGLVYYIDGLGTVWTVDASGRQTSVARFPIGLTQQEVSFAVSPDGCTLEATVLTIPPKVDNPNGPSTVKGTWTLATMSATVGGGPAQVQHTWTAADYPNQDSTFQNIVLVGWDATGPLVVVGSSLGTQSAGYIDNVDYFGGSVAHLDSTGVPGVAIPMPANCNPVQATPTGEITCASNDGTAVAVVNSSGQVEVQPFQVPNAANGIDAAAAPGGWIAVTGQWRKGSASGTLPANFQPEGWIDANTIYGRLGSVGQLMGNAALAHLSGGGATIENLGFQGDYVGMLAA